MSCFFKKLADGYVPHLPPKKKLCRLMSVMLCSVSLIYWPLKKGPIGCPEGSVRNYHFMLLSIPEEHRPHMTIWRCRPWFGSAWSGQSDLVWHSLVEHSVCKFRTTSHI